MNPTTSWTLKLKTTGTTHFLSGYFIQIHALFTTIWACKKLQNTSKHIQVHERKPVPSSIFPTFFIGLRLESIFLDDTDLSSALESGVECQIWSPVSSTIVGLSDPCDADFLAVIPLLKTLFLLLLKVSQNWLPWNFRFRLLIDLNFRLGTALLTSVSSISKLSKFVLNVFTDSWIIGCYALASSMIDCFTARLCTGKPTTEIYYAKWKWKGLYITQTSILSVAKGVAMQHIMLHCTTFCSFITFWDAY